MLALLRRVALALVFISFCISLTARDFDSRETWRKFIAGKYAEVADEAAEAFKSHERGEDWRLIHGRVLLTLGKYPEAYEVVTNALSNYSYSVRLRVLAHEVFLSNGKTTEASDILDEINEMAGNRRWGYRDIEDVVALGQAALLLGADARAVLDNFFEKAKKADPQCRAVYLAKARLALDKHDYSLASKAAQEGLEKFPKDPDLLYELAESLAPSDRGQMLKVLKQVFDANPNHIPAHLLVVEHLIDSEEYNDAEEEIKKIDEVNPHCPEAWAFRGVIAHLKPDPEAEKDAHDKALEFWPTNPRVEYLMGKKLSQKYRFAEGSKYQRQALLFNRNYLPAKIQLANDLLRLGEESEGWTLAEGVAKADAYDIAAYNLVTLHDSISKFSAVTNEHFIVRMAPHEAEVFGNQALTLLEKARTVLTNKYDCPLEQPVMVEIFPSQKDFAVRTFGMPGGEGYLGVCFGNVITANSPSSHEMNWNSVLWHEFTHVITLHLTKNKMPRWFSEGISVYEEHRADPRWGEKLNPKYRRMILDGDMKKIADLSSAFMAPPDGLHLQFAYYESSLVLEFLVEKFGHSSLLAILKDLGEGKNINESIPAHTASIAELEKDFVEFAKGAANDLGSEKYWAKPERDKNGDIEAGWAALHQDNFFVVKEKAEKLLEDQKWDEAIPVLRKCIEIYPGQTGNDNAYALLAEIYRKANQTDAERAVLTEWVKRDDEAKQGLSRLLELEGKSGTWESALNHGRRLLEINPLIPSAYLTLGRAEEETKKTDEAIATYNTALLLDPPDSADLHFHMAKLLHEKKDPEARRHLLLALADAPRFREAHELLLKLADEEKPAGDNQVAK
jgi:tetratricopeptide (TPR) repeat protein